MADVRKDKPQTKQIDFKTVADKFNQNLGNRETTYDFTPGRKFTQETSPLYDGNDG